ncbi:MMPL family transporter [Nocardioides cheoyonin]|uniref:MMPL family transporter n=1 Tax=Nocardioides cheoyonin TaxID=3156615 RepID=UPI0032B4E783
MLTRLADLGIRSPRRILALGLIVLVVLGAFGISASRHLHSGGFNSPDSDSSRAADLLQTRFHTGEANLILEVTAPDGADSTAARAEGRRLVEAIERSPYADRVSSYWTAGRAGSALRSDDGRSALVVATIAGDDSTAPDRAHDIVGPLLGEHDGVDVRAGGSTTVYHQVNDQTTHDLARAEMIAIPITVVVLIWVFGSVVASLLPLAVGLTAIVGTLAILRALSMVTDVSIYALNMTTAMGLALGIDYSLLIVYRYREQLRAGDEPAAAVRHTMQTAGRAVLFSALTVALSLAAMLVFPVYFLRSFAYAGVAVVVLATLAALVLLPVLLTLVGPRIDALDLRAGVRRLLGRPPPQPWEVERSFWYRFARWTMRYAVPVGLAVIALLVAVGLPFLHARFGYPDERVLPSTASAHQVGDSMRERYPTNAIASLEVVAPDVSSAPGALAGYARDLAGLPGVTSVTPPARSGDAAYLSVANRWDPRSDAAKQLVRDVRATDAPWPVLVGGQTATDVDSVDVLGERLPLAIGWIALATFVVLFLFTGSLLLPLKALVLNTLSLSATFGAMVFIFQDGHWPWLFGDLTTTGYLVPTMPLLMFCVAFGLSMDYEVFLLSRIREEWLAGGRTTADNTRAVALGLGRTGRIVTAGALLMAIVFAAIAGSKVSFMMLFGSGLAMAVLMDATIVRGTLVPAFMRVAGRWNWWAPGPLARLHDRIGLHEGSPAPREGEPVAG